MAQVFDKPAEQKLFDLFKHSEVRGEAAPRLTLEGLCVRKSPRSVILFPLTGLATLPAADSAKLRPKVRPGLFSFSPQARKDGVITEA